MLAENIQFVLAFINSKTKTNYDAIPAEEETKDYETPRAEFRKNPKEETHKQTDDYFFDHDIISPVVRGNFDSSQLLSMESNLTNFDAFDEDEFTMEQSKMLENIYKIIDFALS
jgi:hypothetical protein